MAVPIVHHPACSLHNPGPGHPERPARIEAVLAALRAPELGVKLTWHEARSASRRELERVHPAPYLDVLERLARSGGGALDPDTIMSAASWEIGRAHV